MFAGQKAGKPLGEKAMARALEDLNRTDSGEPRWVDPKSGRPITPHGLRATFRTWGEDVGFPRELLEEALGHQIGTAVERAFSEPDARWAVAHSGADWNAQVWGRSFTCDSRALPDNQLVE